MATFYSVLYKGIYCVPHVPVAFSNRGSVETHNQDKAGSSDYPRVNQEVNAELCSGRLACINLQVVVSEYFLSLN